jgi:predicted amidohydrolase
MRVFGAQIDVAGDAIAANRRRAERAIEAGVEAGADLIVLPELWNVGYFAAEAYETAAEPLDGPTLSRIQGLADRHDVWILAGSVIEDLAATDAPTPAQDGLANTSVLFDPTGRRQAVYRKRHLFGFESAEVDLLTPGETLGTASVGEFTVGITTCYDLRFPELFREYVDQGVDLFLVPSAWPYPRIEHWETLTTARALENLAFLVAVNGAGPAGGSGLVGRSRVVDPWGTALRAVGPEAATFAVDVDPDAVTSVRDSFPALEDRRG